MVAVLCSLLIGTAYFQTHTNRHTQKKNCIVQYPVKLRFQNVRQSLPYITEGRYAKTVDKNGKGKGRRATNHWRQIAGNKSIAPPPRLLYVRKREIEIERESRCQLYGRMGGPQGWLDRVKKISSPPVLNPPTVNPLASCYTDLS